MRSLLHGSDFLQRTQRWLREVEPRRTVSGISDSLVLNSFLRFSSAFSPVTGRVIDRVSRAVVSTMCFAVSRGVALWRSKTVLLSRQGTFVMSRPDYRAGRSGMHGPILRALSVRESTRGFFEAIGGFLTGVSRTMADARCDAGAARSLSRLGDRVIFSTGTGRALLLLDRWMVVAIRDPWQLGSYESADSNFKNLSRRRHATHLDS